MIHFLLVPVHRDRTRDNCAAAALWSVHRGVLLSNKKENTLIWLKMVEIGVVGCAYSSAQWATTKRRSIYHHAYFKFGITAAAIIRQAYQFTVHVGVLPQSSHFAERKIRNKQNYTNYVINSCKKPFKCRQSHKIQNLVAIRFPEVDVFSSIQYIQDLENKTAKKS